ncbi:hypothetical protein FA15DRAFT_107923 [Coprinopsis marcescibilis]|uniref:DNA mismatch repair proteins mutS family domain-containing protein n=1 Tax=Coprinopsis marcescibilis TaxID=230819 RepID=A0A5C3L4T5_COPMA|nr:hypothetical protein FA15DRAFT_107923 [Coprinopsis marcescibilis]
MPPRKKKRQITRDLSITTVDSESELLHAKKKVRWEGSTEHLNVEGSDDDDDDERSMASERSEQTCLAAFCTHGRVGFAYHDPDKGLVHVLEDTQETVHFDLTRMLLEQVQPDIVLTSSKSEDGFVDVVRDYMDMAGGIFQIRPFKEFSVKRGSERLLSLTKLRELPILEETAENSASSNPDSHSRLSASRNAYEFMQKRQAMDADPTTQRWNASIRLGNFAAVETSPFCLSSIGALIDHLVRQRAASDYDNDGIAGLDIRDIQVLAVNQVMHINSDALMSLQVFENETHASVHSDKTKEGLSLFGILNGTQTTLGRQLLRTWMLRPSLSVSVISTRHDTVACFMRPENISTANLMHNHLKGIKNMPKVQKALRSGRAQLADWQGFVKFTFHTTMLRGALSELHAAADMEIVKKLVLVLDVATFKETGSKVNDIIDWEESISADRICVRPLVDEELDNWKHAYHGIDSVLSTVARQIAENVDPEIGSNLNVVYFPQLGFLICTPMHPEWQAGGTPVVGEWTFQFSSEAYVYFKSQEMHDMDVHIGDLHSTIVDRELEIIQELLEEALSCEAAISKACDACAELDCLLSLAEASRRNNYVRPRMVQENVIEIVQGRHPLHEQILDTFVANDARLLGGVGLGTTPQCTADGEQWNSVLLCTGANACGKSVYMKQIALIQIMAQIGCFVPAESATLGIVDKIFTRVSTKESVSKAQSAFMIDLNQVSLALRNCTARSLLLLDEFGKGTLSTDGAGLFCGTLVHLLERGEKCPKVLVASHFHEVFTQDLLDAESLPISFCHMQVMFTIDSDMFDSQEDDKSTVCSVPLQNKMTYLYRVAPGLSLDSHAAQCASIFGIPPRIVARAQHVSELISRHEIVKLLDEEITEKEKRDLRDAEAVCRRFLDWNLDDREGVDVKGKLCRVLGLHDDVEESM